MKRSIVHLGRLAGLALTAALTLGASGAAQANGEDVFWSITMSSPGVRVGVSNGSVYGHAPVIVRPAPVYMPPRVVVVPPYPVYRGHPGHYYGHGHGHDKHHGRWEHKSRHYGHDRDDRHYGRDRGDHHARNDNYRGHGGDSRGHAGSVGNIGRSR